MRLALSEYSIMVHSLGGGKVKARRTIAPMLSGDPPERRAALPTTARHLVLIRRHAEIQSP